MSLYDGLDIDKGSGGDKPNISGWSSNYKLLKSQLQAKKAALVQSKRSKPSTTLAPVVDLKKQSDSSDGPLHFNLQTGRIERVPQPAVAISLGASPFIASEPVPSFTGVTDEYEPLRPNDYEDFVKKRKEQRQREREEEDRKRDERRYRNRDYDRERERDRDRDYGGKGEMDRMKRRREEEEEEEFDRPIPLPGSQRGGAAIAPPTSLLEEYSVPPEVSEPPERSKSPPVSFNLGMQMGGSVASKIMAKYGYKEGQGLGRMEQGISTALYVEKTSKRGGKIIHEKDMPKEPPPREPQTNANLMKNPSKVILLRNMVGPGEVDEDLEPETAEECSKYGKVIKCLIFEIPGTDDEEAVRIFIEFEKVDSAIKAIIDLNGRFFGGRIVKACFYNLDKFRRLDLADEVD